MKLPNKPILTIVICTYNRLLDLAVCLNSLNHQINFDFEIIIINSGNKQDLDKLLAKYVKLKINHIHFPVFELAACRNLGLNQAKGEYVAFIDDDTVIDTNWSNEAIKLLQENIKLGGVSGPTLISDDNLQNRDVFLFHNLLTSNSKLAKTIAQWYFNWFMDGDPYAIGKVCKSGAWTPGSNFKSSLNLPKPIDIDYLEACNMVVRKKTAIDVGGFDLSYTKTSEWCEPDLSYKIKNAGYILLFSSKIIVHHYPSKSGIYSKRCDGKSRMENMIRFYLSHIFRWNLISLTKWLSYLLLLNIYWIYKVFKQHNVSWLGGILGTYSGFWKYFITK